MKNLILLLLTTDIYIYKSLHCQQYGSDSHHFEEQGQEQKAPTHSCTLKKVTKGAIVILTFRQIRARLQNNKQLFR